jgi:putative spermidine/putrescine transport system permease protein
MKAVKLQRWILVCAGLILLYGVGATSIGLYFNFPSLFPEQISWENWGVIFNISGLGKALLLSLLVSIIVSLLSTILAFWAGFRTERSNHSLSNLAFYLPYLISPIIFAVCLQVWMIRLNLAGAIPAVILGQLCIAYPYAVILQNGIWNHKLFERIALAKNLGADNWFVTRKLIIPVAKPILILSFIQTFLISWFDFAFVQILGMGKVKTMTLVLYQSVMEADMSIAAISALLIFFPPAILFSMNYKTIKEQWSL